MALDTAPPAARLVLDLADDLADSPGRGVERAVERDGFAEAAGLLVDAGFDVTSGREIELWALRDGGAVVSSLVVSREPEGIAITALATVPELRRRGYAGRLLRAVLGHYALNGVGAAAMTAKTADGEAFARRLGFA